MLMLLVPRAESCCRPSGWTPDERAQVVELLLHLFHHGARAARVVGPLHHNAGHARLQEAPVCGLRGQLTHLEKRSETFGKTVLRDLQRCSEKTTPGGLIRRSQAVMF